ncbi:hypothetical protein Dimus_037263, partial [Dionaea muscipula]
SNSPMVDAVVRMAWPLSGKISHEEPLLACHHAWFPTRCSSPPGKAAHMELLLVACLIAWSRPHARSKATCLELRGDGDGRGDARTGYVGRALASLATGRALLLRP